VLITVLIGTALVMLLTGWLLIFNPRELSNAVTWLVVATVVNFVLNLGLVYFGTPALTGPLGGYFWIWPVFAINAIAALLIFATSSYSEDWEKLTVKSVVISIIALAVLIAGIAILTQWGNGNSKPLAAYPSIVESDKPYPETDTAHMAIVTESIAKFKGGQALGGSGNNLGSAYHAEGYTIQSVKGHLYWVAPLVYNNVFANIANYESPGLVVVDAEDPTVDAHLSLEHKLHYLPEALFNQHLTRYLYINGYDHYRLIDPTLEVDDDWVPHFTVDISSFVRGFIGIKVEGLLIVNSETGKINQYDMDHIPTWVDRVIPGVAAQEYVDWWGSWNTAPWMNFSGQGKQMSADDTPALAYSSADKSPVWQFVMTSTSLKDNSSTGIILFDTKANRGTLYKISGIAVGKDVRHSIETNAFNLMHFTLEEPVLHGIFGQLTWVGTFISPMTGTSEGKATFQAMGILRAGGLEGSSVIQKSNKEELLREYQRWLSSHGSNIANPTNVSNAKEIQATVDRIAADTQSGTTVYYLTLQDQGGKLIERIFSAQSILSEKLPLTHPGDHVVVRYADDNQRVVGRSGFNNLDIAVPLINPTTGAAVATPTVNSTPQATNTPLPTATPTSLPLFEATATP
jgi:hypothetical protein